MIQNLKQQLKKRKEQESLAEKQEDAIKEAA
jgi:hypothetical protein